MQICTMYTYQSVNYEQYQVLIVKTHLYQNFLLLSKNRCLKAENLLNVVSTVNSIEYQQQRSQQTLEDDL